MESPQINQHLIPDKNNLEIFIPVKTHKSIKFINKDLISAILKNYKQEDKLVAYELCVYILSFFRENQMNKEIVAKNLNFEILNKLLRPLSIKVANGLNYKKAIFDALTIGTEQKGAFLTCDNHAIEGKKSFTYTLSPIYAGKGFRKYKVQTEYVKDLINRNIFELVEKTTKNDIIKNIYNFYKIIELPTREELLIKGKDLVNNKFITKSGKKLTMRNKHSDKYFEKDIDARSFVEDNIDTYQLLIDPSYIVPVEGTDNSGGRIIDAITLMPSWIRSEITTKLGEKLVELDFKCLHPNIAMSLYGGDSKFITHDKIAEKTGISRKIVKQ